MNTPQQHTPDNTPRPRAADNPPPTRTVGVSAVVSRHLAENDVEVRGMLVAMAWHERLDVPVDATLTVTPHAVDYRGEHAIPDAYLARLEWAARP